MKKSPMWCGACVTALTCVIVVLSGQTQDLPILSFNGTGRLTFRALDNGTDYTYRVEWAPSPAGPWTNTWATLAAMRNPPVGGVATCSVPMCYRVVATVTADEYMLVDVSAGPSATNYPVTYLKVPPFGGWSDDHKTGKIVLRRVPAGEFTMGSPADELGRRTDETPHAVRLTQDTYVGVFEVTQAQWERVMGFWPSYFTNMLCRATRPVEQVSYAQIRGSIWWNDLAGWPANNNVDNESFMGRLRLRTGRAFDLPTESQWEYACRAGTLSALNSNQNITNLTTDSCMSEVGRYLYNAGPIDPQKGNGTDRDGTTNESTASAGSYRPNAWGLYDMHGNVEEWCLDWCGYYPDGFVTNPPGSPVPDYSTGGANRVLRGGNWYSSPDLCRSATRGGFRPEWTSNMMGFRVTVPPDR